MDHHLLLLSTMDHRGVTKRPSLEKVRLLQKTTGGGHHLHLLMNVLHILMEILIGKNHLTITTKADTSDTVSLTTDTTRRVIMVITMRDMKAGISNVSSAMLDSLSLACGCASSSPLSWELNLQNKILLPKVGDTSGKQSFS